ncbi:MAG: hypothetical protein JOY87_11860, partial [Candidatus Eremiobacteraeota bacterium]|nr:hypothetical protein [Candidatus Eremiobacteraeota bacterium]
QTTFGWLVFLQTLRGAALPFLFTAVGALALVSLKPQDRADASSLYNLTRTLGGSIGSAIIATGLVNRQRFHFERFGESVTQFDVATRQRLAQLTAGVGSHGGPTGLVNAKATAVLSLQLTQQAYISAFDDIALALAAIFFLTSLLIPMFKTERAHMQQGAPAPAME